MNDIFLIYAFVIAKWREFSYSSSAATSSGKAKILEGFLGPNLLLSIMLVKQEDSNSTNQNKNSGQIKSILYNQNIY